MTSQRTTNRAARRPLPLDEGAGPARPIAQRAQAQMIAAALDRAGFASGPNAVLTTTADEGPPLTPPPASHSRWFGAHLFARHTAAASLLFVLGAGSVATAGFAFVRALDEGPAKTALRSRRPPAIRHAVRIETLPMQESHQPELQPPGESSSLMRTPSSRAGGSPDLLAQANALRAVGRWRDAAQVYQRVARGAPSGEPAYVANFAIATLEAEHFKRPRHALRLYQMLLATRPRGALSEEAQLGIAQCYRQLGERAAERAALQIFIQSHPLSLALAQARARIVELQ